MALHNVASDTGSVVVAADFLDVNEGDPLSEIDKLKFALDTLDHPDPFLDKEELPDDFRHAALWCAARSAEQVMVEREKIMADLEVQARHLRCGGVCSSGLLSTSLLVAGQQVRVVGGYAIQTLT
jgi:hypothetical protein